MGGCDRACFVVAYRLDLPLSRRRVDWHCFACRRSCFVAAELHDIHVDDGICPERRVAGIEVGPDLRTATKVRIPLCVMWCHCYRRELHGYNLRLTLLHVLNDR